MAELIALYGKVVEVGRDYNEHSKKQRYVKVEFNKPFKYDSVQFWSESLNLDDEILAEFSLVQQPNDTDLSGHKRLT